MRTVFFDVDTQIDFLFPAGALYVPGAESIVPAIARLNQWASTNGIPLISTLDTHAENDPEFPAHRFPAHCVKDTVGWQKPASTMAGQRFVVKHTFDCFTSPDLAPLLEEFAAERYVVYGVVTEICVKFAAMGLLRTGRRVELVADAVRQLNAANAEAFLAEFRSAGGIVTTVDDVCRVQ